MPKFAGRSNAACNYCHRQKVKCNGEQPCQRCRQRQRHCIYRTRGDRTVTVPEEYLDNLNTTLNELTSSIRATRNSSFAPMPGSATPRAAEAEAVIPPPTAQAQAQRETEDAVAPIVDDSTTESFVRKLKQVLYNVGGSENALMTLAAAFPALASPSSSSASSQRRHVNLKFDNIHSKLLFKLPPYKYAVQLISQAEQSFGDYHTFLRKSFWRRLHATYQNLSSQANDRNWLCRLSFILAIAEANNHNNQSLTITFDESGGVPSWQGKTADCDDIFHTLPPGTEYFEQGLLMLKIRYEDPTVDDVEALNLASHCSFILNRRKAAYAYAGQSIRLAHSLGLDQPAPACLSNLEREHRKRVWWTAFCVDRATSTELCLRPAYVGMESDLAYPDSSGLSAEELEEFFDPDLLTAQIKLLRIKSDVISVVKQMKTRLASQSHDLFQCLNRLEQFRKEMPAKLAPLLEFEFQTSLDEMPDDRVLFSLSLRYFQCYILLMRPLLLHQLASTPDGDVSRTTEEEAKKTNTICLQAAMTNAKTMLYLTKSEMLVEYGYWDSVHLFSSLTVICLAKIMTNRLPGPFLLHENEWEDIMLLYDKAREVLVNMVQCGNVASKHHMEMLNEIDLIRNAIPSSRFNSNTNMYATSTLWPTAQRDSVENGDHGAFQTGDVRLGRELGFEEWAELLEQPVIDFTSFDLHS